MKDSKINYKAFSLQDQIFFSQRLSLLLNSGIPIVEALLIMRNMESSRDRRKIYETIILNIEHGVSLSKSIKNLNLRFSNLLSTLIQNGESGGHLSEALKQAYEYLEKRNDMKKKVISSLIYPCFIILATIIMTLFLILYIFPKIIPLLTSLDIKLPLVTRVVQEIYYFIISYGLYSVFGCLILFFIFRFLIKKSKYIKYNIDRLVIYLPFTKTYLMSSVCTMGEMMLSSGKGLTDMIIFSRDSIKNTVYKSVFENILRESLQGVSFSASLKKYSILFPLIMPDMCALGERTGSLASMLGHCGKIFEQDIDNNLRKFSSLIEPILMVFMGLIVGSVALSIILPVYEITNHLTK